MTIELLQNLSLASYILAGIFLLISVVLFFRLDVIKLIGDFTGVNERKAIESMRQQNEDGVAKGYKPSKTSSSRGNVTDKISPSGRLQHNTSKLNSVSQTEKFSTKELTPSGNETTVLTAGANETTVLSAGINETTVLSPSMNETTVLSQGMLNIGETTVLSQGTAGVQNTAELQNTADLQNNVELQHTSMAQASAFRLEIEMCFLGSAELIE